MRALVVVDLGFGDGGKGSVVDYLVREHQAPYTVFFNGGAQRLHNVVTEDGRHHPFSQWGSGTFAGARTFHSDFSMVNPINLLNEGNALVANGVPDAFDRVTFDHECPVITRFHVAANRLRELARGASKHGSCGQGIGETAHDVERGLQLTMGDLILRGHDLDLSLMAIQERKLHELSLVGITPPAIDAPDEWNILTNPKLPEALAAFYNTTAKTLRITDGFRLTGLETVIFEGSQGVLLDGDYGFDPHTTWSDCTFNNALTILDGYDTDVTRIGVTRAYGVRHGPGPFPTEASDLGLGDPHNMDGPWQGPLRCGYTDLVLLGYALDVVGGIDTLAVTCLDQLPVTWKVCRAYQPWLPGDLPITSLHHTPDVVRNRARTIMLEGSEPIYEVRLASEVPRILSEAADVPVSIESWGPTAANKRQVPDRNDTREIQSRPGGVVNG